MSHPTLSENAEEVFTLAESTRRLYAIQARLEEEHQKKRQERAVRYILRIADLDAARADVANVLRRMGLQHYDY